MRHLEIIASYLLAACTSSSSQTPATVDIDAAWRVRCPDCTYPERMLSEPIAATDPGNLYAQCKLIDGKLDIGFGRANYDDPGQSVPGFSVDTLVAYDPATGFDLAQLCQVNVGEEDSRQWGRACSDAGDCSLEAPTLVDGALSFTLRCAGMPSIPAQAGSVADLAAAADPAAAISVQISPCEL